MSTITKDKNIVTFAIDGCNGNYTLDINTGVFYGLRGKPVKSCNRRKEIYDAIDKNIYLRTERPNLRYVLRSIFFNCHDTLNDERLPDILRCADKLDSLHCPQFVLFWTDYAYLSDKIKIFMQYCQGKNSIRISAFSNWYNYEQGKKKYGKILNGLTVEMYAEINRYIPDFTTQELSACAYYLVKGKLWEFEGGCINRLADYIQFCRCIGKEPIKTSNFMREYCETQQLYKSRQIEFDNQRLISNYAKQAKAWQFECGDFTIVIPTSGQDIVTEGEKMHHCVGRYVNRVVNNEKYICFVRRKNDIETPYITCEVFTNGVIGQYFLAFDKKISSAEDEAFREAFQEHLLKVWIKQE